MIIIIDICSAYRVHFRIRLFRYHQKFGYFQKMKIVQLQEDDYKKMCAGVHLLTNIYNQ